MLHENQQQIYFNDVGSGETIIFLHGWPLNHSIFLNQVKALSQQGYRCISVDLRGFGRSQLCTTSFTLEDFVDDIKRLVDSLNLTSIILCGFSFGALLALKFVSQFKSVPVKKLFLIAPAAPKFTPDVNYPYGTDQKILTLMIDQCIKNRVNLLQNFSQFFFHQANEQLLKDFFLVCEPANPIAMQSVLKILRDVDLRRTLHEIFIPTLIVHGIEDRISPYALGQYLQVNLMHAELELFTDCGHDILWQKGTEINALIASNC